MGLLSQMRAVRINLQSYKLSISVCGVLLLCSSFVQAGIFEDDEARKAILDLRTRVDQLRKDTDQNRTEDKKLLQAESAQEIGLMRRAVVDLQGQLDAAKADNARLRGQLEQLAKAVADEQIKGLDAIRPLDDRLKKLEPLKVTVDGVEILAEQAEKKAFDTALGQFRKGDFAASQDAFMDLLARYPQTGYVASATFWIGNTQFLNKEYKASIATLRKLVTRFNTHARVPEAYLSIANSHIELKESRTAKKTLEELIALAPGSEAAATAKERLAKLK